MNTNNIPSSRWFASFTLLALLLGVALPATAQTSTWSGATTGGSWNTAGNWTPSGIPNLSTANLVFNESFTTNTADTNQVQFTLDATPFNVNSIIYQDTSAKHLSANISTGAVASATLTFSGSTPSVDNPSNTETLTISAPAAMPNGLTKGTGIGTVTFPNPANLDTAGGTLAVNGGVLVFNTYLPGFASGTVASGAALQTALNALTQPNVPLTISGSGNSLAPGALYFRNATVAVTWPGQITLAGATTIYSYGNDNQENFTGGITGTGPLVLQGGGGGSGTQTGVMTISNTACTYSGNTSIQNNNGLAYFLVRLGVANALPATTVLALNNVTNSGSLNGVFLDLNAQGQTLAGLTNDSFLASSKYCVINSSTNVATLTLANSSPCTFTGEIGTNSAAAAKPNANISLVVAGTSTFTLGGTNQYTNSTIISSGTLALASTGSISNSALIDVAGGATFNVTALASGFVTGSAQTLTNDGTVSGAVTVGSGSQLIGAGTVSGAVTNNSGGTLAPGDSGIGTLTVGSLTLSSGSTDDFGFSTTPSSTNSLVSATTSGGLTVNGGIIYLYQAGTTTPFTTPGTYNLFQYSGSLAGAGAGSLLVGNPQAGYTYGFSAAGGYVKVTINSGGAVVYWNVDGNGSWNLNTDWTPTTVPNHQDAIANFGGGGATLTQAITVALNGNQTVGVLNFNNPNYGVTIDSGTPATSALTLSASSSTPQINDVAGSHDVQVAIALPASGVNLSVASASSLEFDGAISGSGTLNLSGGGTVNLTGTNTCGGITVSGSILDVTGNGTLGSTSGALNVNGGSTLDLGTSTQTVGLVSLANSTIQNGTLTGTSFACQGGTVDAVLAGSGGLANTTGTLTLNNANTYAGTTTVSGGTLSVSDDTNLGTDPASPTPGNLVLNGGTLSAAASFALAANRGLAVGPATGSGSGLIDVPNGGTLTCPGVIANNGSGNGTLIVGPTGTGTCQLSGTNTYTGGSWITNGILELQNDQSAANGGYFVGPQNAGTCFLQIDAGATVVVAATNTFQVGNNVAGGIATAPSTVNDSGVVTNYGSLYAGRISALNLLSGATWWQSGPMTIQALGNLAANLTVNAGATFTYTGTNAILVDGPGASFGPAGTLTIGGTFITGQGFEQNVTYTTGTGMGIVRMNGGTLQLSAPVPNLFFGSAGTNNVRCSVANNCTIDTQGFNVTNNVGITGAGNLTKLGTGNLVMTGTNTYTGTTTVVNGNLVGVVGGTVSSDVTVAATNGFTANLSVSVPNTNNSWSCASVTIDNTINGGTGGLDFNFGKQIPGTTVAPLIVTNAANFNSTPNVTVEVPNSGIVAGATQYPLTTWGSTSGTAPTAVTINGSHATGHLVVSGNTLYLVIDTVATEPLKWLTSGAGNWDTNAPNWKDSSGNGPFAYSEVVLPGDAVVFDDTYVTADTTVTLNATVTPTSVLAANSAHNYTITGTGGITGASGLSKSGTAALTLGGSNSYSGATTVSAGTLKNGSPSAFTGSSSSLTMSGTSVFDLNGYNASFAAVAAGAASATITDNSAGAGTTTLTVTNQGNTTIADLIKDGASKKVGMVIAFNNNASLPDFNLASANTFSGGLTLGSGSGPNRTRLWINAAITGTPFGLGPIIIGQSATDAAQLGLAGVSNTLANNIVVNSAVGTDTTEGIRVDTTNTLAGTINANLANLSIGGAGTAILTGQITGNSGLDVHTATTTVILDNATANSNNYQGNTIIESATGTLQMGAASQIPNGSAAGYVTNNGTLALNGHNQTINGLTGSGVVDGVSGTPVFTLGGNNANGFIFSGVIKNTAGSLSLAKIGSGTNILSGMNAYSGNTTVNGGTLAIQQPTLAANSTVTVAGGAVLELDFAVTNQVGALILNGSSAWAGVHNHTTDPAYLTGAGSLLVVQTGPGTFTNPTGITGFSLNGANVVINGTNGQAGDAYYLLTSTNLTQPISQWKPVATNVPGSAGNYSFTATNAVIPGALQQFFRLSNTNN